MMRFCWNFTLLAASLCSRVLSEETAPAQGLLRRQIFTTLPLVCTGVTCLQTTSSTARTISSTTSSSNTTSTTSSPSASKTSSPSFFSSTISTVSPTSSATSSVSYNEYAVTTTFTQPPSCTGGFTAIEEWGTDIYDNVIYSQSGFDLAYTTCFPPQFYNSILASIASTTLGPFTALICPYTWESYDLNSTYVICCPSGYNLLAPNWGDSIRPGAGAVCTSSIGASGLLDITSFDSTGGETVVPATAGSSGTFVWAYAFDGTTTSVSIPSATSSTSFQSTTSSSSGAQSTSALRTMSSTSSTWISTTIYSSTSTSSLSKSTKTSTGTAIPGESTLPACRQTCFNNMLAQYSTLGCAHLDAYCLCNNVNFGYGIRDCSNSACGTDVASTVIAFGSAYCSTASATHTRVTPTPSITSTAIPGESALPSCGQLCFNNMLSQYSTLGCAPLDAYCLCNNANFGYGIRDCSNGACGADVASSVISFGSASCSTATATHTVQAPLITFS